MSTQRDQLIEIAARALTEWGLIEDYPETAAAAVIDALGIKQVAWRSEVQRDWLHRDYKPKGDDWWPVFRLRGLESAPTSDSSTSV